MGRLELRLLSLWLQPGFSHCAFDEMLLNSFAVAARKRSQILAHMLGSTAVNFIGEPHAVHCGPWFCLSSMTLPLPVMRKFGLAAISPQYRSAHF